MAEGRTQDKFIHGITPGPATLGGCCGLERPVTVKAFILKGLPPPWPWPWPGFLLGVDFCLPPLPPRPLPLFDCLLLNRLCLFCGLPGEGEWPAELFLLPELLHCQAQWFRRPHLLHVVLWAGQLLAVRASTLATGFLGRAFLKRLRQSTGLHQRIGVITEGCHWVSLFMYLILLAGPFMGLCYLNHTVIFKLLLLGIVNELPNLKSEQ